jgi:hypothetical protein
MNSAIFLNKLNYVRDMKVVGINMWRMDDEEKKISMNG